MQPSSRSRSRSSRAIRASSSARNPTHSRAPQAPQPAPRESYTTRGGLDHVGVVVDDLDAAEARLRAEGAEPHSHADCEPGRRFHFHDGDGIEYEVLACA